MISLRITLHDGSFDDISANRQRVIISPVAPPRVGDLLELVQSGQKVCRRIVSHVYACEQYVLLSIRPLTSAEKTALTRDAAPDAPTEAG